MTARSAEICREICRDLPRDLPRMVLTRESSLSAAAGQKGRIAWLSETRRRAPRGGPIAGGRRAAAASRVCGHGALAALLSVLSRVA